MTNPYHIICPNCSREITLDTPETALPDVCPHCQTHIGDDYGIVYQPSTHSKTYRTIALAILIFFFLLFVLGVVVLLFKS
jgi:uncharacterized paraquat-inducible protein A